MIKYEYIPNKILEDCDREWEYQEFLSNIKKECKFANKYFYNDKIINNLFEIFNEHDYNRIFTLFYDVSILQINNSVRQYMLYDIYYLYLLKNKNTEQRYDNIIKNVGFWKGLKLKLQYLSYDELYKYLLNDEQLLIKFIK